MTATTETLPDAAHAAGAARGRHTTYPGVSLAQLTRVELRKMFDTRAGLWMLLSIGVLSVLATGAVIAFAPDAAITYDNVGAAIGIPLSVILPIIAILSVTSEYSQRTGLATYTLVPKRGRVITAKAVAAFIVGVVGMVVALGVGALGNLLGAAIVGIDPVWNVAADVLAQLVLGNLLGMAIGFMLGVVLRNSPAAIVGYFVFSLVLPGALALLAAFQQWFADLQPWVDVNFAMSRLYNETLTGEMWAQLGVSGALWIALPMAVGLFFTLRAEVK